MADRIAPPGRIQILGMLLAIQKNLAKAMQVSLKQNNHQVGLLDDLGWIWVAPRRSGGKAARFRIFHSIVGLPLFEELLAERGHGHFADVVILGDVGSVTGVAPGG